MRAAALDSTQTGWGESGLMGGALETESDVGAHPTRYASFPLTDVQQAYYLGRGDATAGVAVHGYFEVEGPVLDVADLECAWNKVVARHPMLRTVLEPDLHQRELVEVPWYAIRTSDCSSDDEADAKTAAIRAELSHQVLPADQWPLFDIRYVLVPGGLGRLHLSIDALVADGTSVRTILEEWSRFYAEPNLELSPVPVTFQEYIAHLGADENSPGYERAKAYWTERMPGLGASPMLPVRRAIADIARPRFDTLFYRLSSEEWKSLRSTARKHRVTASSLLLACYAETIAAYATDSHFSLVLTVFNRLPVDPAINEVVGDFTSTSILDVDDLADAPIARRAQSLQRRLFADLDHRQFSGVRVVREYNRRHAHSVQGAAVVFTSNLDGDDMNDIGFESFGEIVEATNQTPGVLLDHVVVQQQGCLNLIWNVVAEAFEPGVPDDMFATYGKRLRQLAADPSAWDVPWSDPRLPEHVSEHLAANRTDRDWSDRGGLHRLEHRVYQQVLRTPGAPAVVSFDATLTYAALWLESGEVAAHLSGLGVTPGSRVAVICPIGWQSIAAVLGVLRAGAAYVPVGCHLPEARRRAVLAAAGPLAAVVRAEDAVELGAAGVPMVTVRQHRPVDVDGAPEPPQSDPRSINDLAYVIFTSGTTGVPKGVMITHRAASNTLVDVTERIGLTADDAVLAVSDLGFDLSVFDVFGTLAAGGTLVLPGDGAPDPRAWLRLVDRHHVTIWNSVPALFRLLADAIGSGAGGSSIRRIMLSGDWIPLDTVDWIAARLPHARLLSLGGATEAAIWSVSYPTAGREPEWPSVPYGRPLANQSCAVVDDAGRPRPTWAAGELVLRGDGVALGYLGDPTTTAAKFFTDPQTCAASYRTGDLVRYRPGGVLQFLGRLDSQVKINGNRIELGEIESTLCCSPEVADAVAAVQNARNGRQLTAFVVPSDSGVDPVALSERLRALAREHLPAYMVPHVVGVLAAVPISPNGKLDRSRLPEPVIVESDNSDDVSDLERRVCLVYAQELGVASVGVHDDFFALGGDSLAAARIMARIREELDVDSPWRAVFEARTVSDVVQLLDAQGVRDSEQVRAIESLPDDEASEWLARLRDA